MDGKLTPCPRGVDQADCCLLRQGGHGRQHIHRNRKSVSAAAGQNKNVSPQHTVMSGDNFQDTWYVPGGKSFHATLFQDAQLDYLYKNNREQGSIGLDIESVLTRFGKAEFWFGCEADTYAELAEKDAKYLLLQSVKKRQVYSNHNRITTAGGNDYFESAIANPDLLLSDLVKAAYPEILPDYSFTYIKPLEELPARE